LRVPLRAAGLALVVATAAGCGSASPTPVGSPPPVGSLAPVASPTPAMTGALRTPAATGSPAPSAATAPGPSITADGTLLDLIRATDAGMTLTYDPETTAGVIGDPAVARDASAMATGLAVPTGQASPEEFVIVNAVRLRDPSVGETWFRTWRDTYDAAACRQAGGVQGHAESEISGRTVYIGSCANGVYTYHTRVEDGSVVLSLTSIGPSRLGERLLAHVAP
jgi:hypothetical protein